jgi:ketosteroid isomerase-like protein
MAAGWRTWLSAWDRYVTETDEYRELDAQRVLVRGRARGRGKTSGLPVEMEFVNVWEISAGKVVRLRLYADLTDALADLGLPSAGLATDQPG